MGGHVQNLSAQRRTGEVEQQIESMLAYGLRFGGRDVPKAGGVSRRETRHLGY
jgi:hypothetical protein